MTYEQFKQKIFTQAKRFGFTDYELYYTAANGFEVKIFNGQIADYENANTIGLSFRGSHNNRVGYAYTEKLDEALIPILFKNAAENAAIIEEKEIEKLYRGDRLAVDRRSTLVVPTSCLSTSEKIAAALALEKHAYSLDTRIKSIDYCILGTVDTTTAIANSHGLDLSHQTNAAFAFLVPRAQENNSTKVAHEFWAGPDLRQFDYKSLAAQAVQKTIAQLGASSIASGDYPILFDRDPAIELFQAFAGIFFAENVQKGFSLLKDKLGTAIAAKGITLRDDAHCDVSFITIPFDSEGVTTQNKAIIENGTLKTLLHNTKSAAKDNTQPTGNGFRQSFRAPITTSYTNLYLQPSTTPREQILATIPKGILITELEGIHAGVNTTSGDFSLSAAGFLIQNGKTTRPLEQITVAGNFYHLLKNITAIANDLRFQPPSSSPGIV
ncbi:MAG: TldD/PmbA family protein, partial [Phycisphaerales bacterium]|nr:TldD/PmbA family protein [Phycisphaerales bacterium]